MSYRNKGSLSRVSEELTEGECVSPSNPDSIASISKETMLNLLQIGNLLDDLSDLVDGPSPEKKGNAIPPPQGLRDNTIINRELTFSIRERILCLRERLG